MTSEMVEREVPGSAPQRMPPVDAEPRGTAAGVVGIGLVLAAPLVAVLAHLAASDAATFASWVVLVVGLVAWSPVSRRWPRVRRLGPGVAFAYLAVGALLLLAPA